MLVQSAVSLLLAALVIARAVNILRSLAVNAEHQDRYHAAARAAVQALLGGKTLHQLRHSRLIHREVARRTSAPPADCHQRPQAAGHPAAVRPAGSGRRHRCDGRQRPGPPRPLTGPFAAHVRHQARVRPARPGDCAEEHPVRARPVERHENVRETSRDVNGWPRQRPPVALASQT